MSYDPERITYFAKTDARGSNVPFGIKAKDRTRHVYVIGKTGMGKSTLLENMAVQDIANGEGMAFIDPHGQTAETLLDYIPEHRKKDVLYFAPFDMECPVSFNVMEDVGADKRHLVASGLMSVFKKIFVDAWSARMEYILTNTLLALLEYPDSTLLGVNRMLSDKDYRKKVIDNITDPSVKSFWVDEFLKYNERYMQEAGDAIKNKIGQFTANPLIRNIIGQPKSSFDIREMMDEKKILIMNLSKGLIGETNANLLGSMLITRIYLAAMSRAELSPKEMDGLSNFYFYVDEFQSFANEAFANILSEARKYKLNLTIAHQYIEQMEEEVRNAVFGNVGTTITFRVGPFDAEVMEPLFQPKFFAVDICNLGFAQIYLTLMIDGVGSQPFSASTLPPIETKSVSCKDMVMAGSREQFSQPRLEVEDAINKWHEPEPPTRRATVDSKGNPIDAKGKPVKDGKTAASTPPKENNGAPKSTSTTPQGQVKPNASQNQSSDTKSNNNTRSVNSPAQNPVPRNGADAPKSPVAQENTPRTPTVVPAAATVRAEAAPSVPTQGSNHTQEKVSTRPVPRSNGEGNNTNHKNSDRSPSRQNGSEKSLSELRSVLAGMTAAEPKTEKSTNTNPKKNADTPQKTKDAPSNLKNALGKALEQVKTVSTNDSQKKDASKQEKQKDKKAAPVQTSPKTESVVKKFDPVDDTGGQSKSFGQPAHTFTPKAVVDTLEPSDDSRPQKPNAEKESTDELDPKQLERMMRVTTSDRTPLK